MRKQLFTSELLTRPGGPPLTHRQREALVADFARRLAHALGWTVDDGEEWTRTLRAPTGHGYYVDGRGHRKADQGRITIAPALGRRTPGGKGLTCWTKRPSITVDVRRPIEDIARDVQRRLLPAAVEAHRAADAHLAQALGYEYMERHACGKLGIELRPGTQRGSRYLDMPNDRGSVEVTVHEGANVAIRCRALRLDVALQVMAVLEGAGAAPFKHD